VPGEALKLSHPAPIPSHMYHRCEHMKSEGFPTAIPSFHRITAPRMQKNLNFWIGIDSDGRKVDQRFVPSARIRGGTKNLSQLILGRLRSDVDAENDRTPPPAPRPKAPCCQCGFQQPPGGQCETHNLVRDRNRRFSGHTLDIFLWK